MEYPCAGNAAVTRGGDVRRECPRQTDISDGPGCSSLGFPITSLSCLPKRLKVTSTHHHPGFQFGIEISCHRYWPPVRLKETDRVSWFFSFFFFSFHHNKENSVYSQNRMWHRGLNGRCSPETRARGDDIFFARSAKVVCCYILSFPSLLLDALKTEECDEHKTKMMKNNKLEIHSCICSHLFFFFFLAGNTKSRSHQQYFGYTLLPKVSEP